MKNKRGKGLQRSTLERLDDTSQLARTLRGEDEGQEQVGQDQSQGPKDLVSTLASSTLLMSISDFTQIGVLHSSVLRARHETRRLRALRAQARAISGVRYVTRYHWRITGVYANNRTRAQGTNC